MPTLSHNPIAIAIRWCKSEVMSKRSFVPQELFNVARIQFVLFFFRRRSTII